MKRLVAFLAVCGIALGLSVGLAGTASAAGPELACRISPAPTTAQFTSPACTQTRIASSYAIGYEVLDQTGSATYAWTVPAGHTINGGCTSTSNGCNVQATGLKRDQMITVSVTVIQGATRQTVSATAILSAQCGTVFC